MHVTVTLKDPDKGTGGGATENVVWSNLHLSQGILDRNARGSESWGSG